MASKFWLLIIWDEQSSYIEINGVDVLSKAYWRRRGLPPYDPMLRSTADPQPTTATNPVNISSGRNLSTRRKPTTFGRALTNSSHMSVASPNRDSNPRSQSWKALALTIAPTMSVDFIFVEVANIQMELRFQWFLELASNSPMDDSSYRLNFNPGKKNKIQYRS